MGTEEYTQQQLPDPAVIHARLLILGIILVRGSARAPHQSQSIDNWLCELRDLSRKCEFEVGCCHLCKTERLLGRIVNGVTDNDVRIKLLEVGPNLSLDQAIGIVRTSEMSKLQAEQNHPGESVQSIHKSAYKKAKSFKVTKAAAAATTKANHGTSGATCNKCGFEIRDQEVTNTQPKTTSAENAKLPPATTFNL